MPKKLGLILNSETVKEELHVAVENAVNIMSGDLLAVKDLIKQLFTAPERLRDGIYLECFLAYLLCVYDYDPEKREFIDNNNRKLAEMLAEVTPNPEAGYEGNPSVLKENAKRIVKLIDEAGTIQKAIYYANLTRAAINGHITRDHFFKLSNCVRMLTDEDLIFFEGHIQKQGTGTIKDDYDFIDDYRSVGLLKEVKDGFSYTQRAFELLKYGLKYEDTVIIPADIQKRMMVSFPETWDGGFEVHGETLEFKKATSSAK